MKITNAMKYMTIEERSKAFDAFCNSFVAPGGCIGCPLDNVCDSGTAMASFAWLELEANSHKEVLNCPYCGDKCVCEQDDIGNWTVHCENCLYQMGGQGWSEDEVASKHNCIARTVKTSEEKEAK